MSSLRSPDDGVDDVAKEGSGTVVPLAPIAPTIALEEESGLLLVDPKLGNGAMPWLLGNKRSLNALLLDSITEGKAMLFAAAATLLFIDDIGLAKGLWETPLPPGVSTTALKNGEKNNHWKQ